MNCNMRDLGTLLPNLFTAVKACLKQATNVSQKYLKCNCSVKPVIAH